MTIMFASTGAPKYMQTLPTPPRPSCSSRPAFVRFSKYMLCCIIQRRRRSSKSIMPFSCTLCGICDNSKYFLDHRCFERMERLRVKWHLLGWRKCAPRNNVFVFPQQKTKRSSVSGSPNEGIWFLNSVSPSHRKSQKKKKVQRRRTAVGSELPRPVFLARGITANEPHPSGVQLTRLFPSKKYYGSISSCQQQCFAPTEDDKYWVAVLIKRLPVCPTSDRLTVPWRRVVRHEPTSIFRRKNSAIPSAPRLTFSPKEIT